MRLRHRWAARRTATRIRSITVTADRKVLLANVHVGGIPRSTDGGMTWHPTIDIDTDVHEVCGHATDPRIVIAAAAVGLCVSHDGGATWTVEQNGLHASLLLCRCVLGQRHSRIDWVSYGFLHETRIARITRPPRHQPGSARLPGPA